MNRPTDLHAGESRMDRRTRFNVYEFKQSKSEIGLGRRAFTDASSVADGWSVFLGRRSRGIERT